ncbi:hypothetical protein [Natrialba aegyptia]|uniref:Uncharacterized protein n=1 Tax=Natrialba aegyptia DSM 13077 TaxID=1227491 RepID=M0BCC1_9EURY|nr:hypothetical protein [Natrialba aegyptia]ELZ07314.1 hypothetical protein C480_04641 [Natrialba aegyptia DSM 13077]
MNTNHSPEDHTEATETFEADLKTLITSAFAHGAAIEATWVITTPLADAPDWIVTVERENSDSQSSDSHASPEK